MFLYLYKTNISLNINGVNKKMIQIHLISFLYNLNKKLTFIHQKRSCWRVFFSSSTFFIFKPLKHNTVQSASSNYYIYSFHTPFGKFHFPSVHRTSYHNQMPRQHHSHGFPLLSDLCALSM